MTHVTQVLDAFADLYPRLDATGLYCLFTGAQIGESFKQDLYSVIDSLEGEPDECADQLAHRIVNSSRPSLYWNHIRVADIDAHRNRMPVETFAYLLNGCGGVKRDAKDFFESMLARIYSFQDLCGLDSKELDQRWYDFYRCEEEALAESQKAARMMRHWLANVDPIGQKARHDSVIARLHQEAEDIRTGKKRGRVKPVKVLNEKEIARAANISMATAFLDSIMNGLDLEPLRPLPIIPDSRPSGAGFRIKMPSAPAVAQEA